ncbi:MAG: hypothetical protein F6K00_01205 [Leptolyngbya sp. SIOISBB]|nr:hypothetical protein [Leptolyngbya sp. SIOISBB]
MDTAQINRIIDKLVESQLIRLTPSDAPGDEHIELVHEALIDNWPRYQQWLEAEQLTRYKRLRLAKDAQDWQAQGRPSDFLWQGQLLQAAKSYQNLSALETEFLEASEDALQAASLQEENLLNRLDSLRQELEAVRAREQTLQQELSTIQAVAKRQEETFQERLHSFEANARLHEQTLQERIQSLEASLKTQEESLREEARSLEALSAEALRYKQKYQRSLILTALLFVSTVAAITFAVIQTQDRSSQHDSWLKELPNPPQSEISGL